MVPKHNEFKKKTGDIRGRIEEDSTTGNGLILQN